jgi:hypothetical protein
VLQVLCLSGQFLSISFHLDVIKLEFKLLVELTESARLRSFDEARVVASVILFDWDRADLLTDVKLLHFISIELLLGECADKIIRWSYLLGFEFLRDVFLNRVGKGFNLLRGFRGWFWLKNFSLLWTLVLKYFKVRLLELIRGADFFFEVVEFELSVLFFCLTVLIGAIFVFADQLLLLCESLKFYISIWLFPIIREGSLTLLGCVGSIWLFAQLFQVVRLENQRVWIVDKVHLAVLNLTQDLGLPKNDVLNPKVTAT